MNTILLGIIATAEIVRLYLVHRKVSKRAYFKGKLQGVDRAVWDLTFKIFKTREIREGVRRDRDDRKMKLETLGERIVIESKTGGLKETNIDEFKRLEDQKVLLERDVKRYEDQMRMLDVELEGERPSGDIVGSPGINDQIDSLVELREMLKDWVKRV